MFRSLLSYTFVHNLSSMALQQNTAESFPTTKPSTTLSMVHLDRFSFESMAHRTRFPMTPDTFLTSSTVNLHLDTRSFSCLSPQKPIKPSTKDDLSRFLPFFTQREHDTVQSDHPGDNSARCHICHPYEPCHHSKRAFDWKDPKCQELIRWIWLSRLSHEEEIADYCGTVSDSRAMIGGWCCTKGSDPDLGDGIVFYDVYPEALVLPSGRGADSSHSISSEEISDLKWSAGGWSDEDEGSDRSTTESDQGSSVIQTDSTATTTSSVYGEDWLLTRGLDAESLVCHLSQRSEVSME